MNKKRLHNYRISFLLGAVIIFIEILIAWFFPFQVPFLYFAIGISISVIVLIYGMYQKGLYEGEKGVRVWF